MAAAHDDDPIRASVTAFESLRFGRWRPAEQTFATALRLMDPPPHGDGISAAAQRRPWLVGRTEALVQLGDMAQAERCLLEAFPALLQPRPVGAAHDAVEARALLWLARVSLAARHPGDAVAALRRALSALPGCQPAGSRLSELRARILEMMAVGLSATGEVKEALKLHAGALAVFEHPLHTDSARERAVALVNRGIGE